MKIRSKTALAHRGSSLTIDPQAPRRWACVPGVVYPPRRKQAQSADPPLKVPTEVPVGYVTTRQIVSNYGVSRSWVNLHSHKWRMQQARLPEAGGSLVHCYLLDDVLVTLALKWRRKINA